MPRLAMLGENRFDSCRARHFLKNSPISANKKFAGEASSKKVTGLARVRHLSADSRSTSSLNDLICTDLTCTWHLAELIADLRPSMPEVAGRLLPPMASCRETM